MQEADVKNERAMLFLRSENSAQKRITEREEALRFKAVSRLSFSLDILESACSMRRFIS